MKTPFVSSSALVCCREFINANGGDAESLFEEVGLAFDPEHSDDRFCSFNSMLALYEIAAQSLSKPNFGLELALSLPPDFAHFSPFVYLGHFEKNARSWFKSAAEFQAMFTDAHRPELIEFPEREEAVIRLNIETQLLLPRQWREFQMAGVTLLVQSLLKTPEAKAKVTRMRHAKPTDTSLHHRIFGEEIEFGAEEDEFVIERRLLDLKLNGRARFLRPLIGLYMSHKMRDRPQVDLSLEGSVRLYLQCVMGMGKAALKDAALAMGMSEKKLQRLLAEEGTSYSEVLDDLRRKKAMSLLRTPDLKVKLVSSMLDYSGTPAFTLAFKRWTGMSPEAYRDVLRANGEMLELQ